MVKHFYFFLFIIFLFSCGGIKTKHLSSSYIQIPLDNSFFINNYKKLYKKGSHLKIDYESIYVESYYINNSGEVFSSKDGSHSVRLSDGAGGVEQTVTGLKANTTYTLSGWAFKHPLATNTGLYVGVKNYGGVELSTEVTETTYTKKSVTFTTGANNTTARIYFYRNGGASNVYGDYFRIVEGSTPAARAQLGKPVAEEPIEEDFIKDLSIYPNPVVNGSLLNVGYNSKLSNEKINISLVNLLGQEVLSKSYNLEKAKSWPNLAVGPRVQTQPGPQGGTFIGAAVSVPIPILSLNGGGKEKALAQQKKREIEKRLIDRKLKIESQRLVNTYNRSIASHSKAIKSSTILKKHKRLHRMINRGVVSPAMVIQLHKEIIEFYESLHEHELDAVRTRWQYYSLHGKLDNETIQKSEVN